MEEFNQKKRKLQEECEESNSYLEDSMTQEQLQRISDDVQELENSRFQLFDVRGRNKEKREKAIG